MTFTTYDQYQNETQVDCSEVQCGIITIGAHGVDNANNESFTPFDFAASGAAAGKDAEKNDNDEKKSSENKDKKKDDEAASGIRPKRRATRVDPATVPMGLRRGRRSGRRPCAEPECCTGGQ